MATCQHCGKDIIHVRDAFTGATFPVDAEPIIWKGFELGRPEAGARNPPARFNSVELYVPHAPICEEAEQRDIEKGESSE